MSSIGIVLGLTAAFLQSISYVFSRRYNVAGHGGATRILVISHVLLSGMAVILLPLFWHEALLDWRAYAVHLAGAAGWYLIGQFFMFLALKGADASRIAPLLGLKIAMAAGVWVTLGDGSLSTLQWTAVGLSVGAAFVLNYTGGALPMISASGVIFTCFFYALSDLDIVTMIDGLEGKGMSRIQASAASACLSYIVCGLAAIPLLPIYGSRETRHWTAAIPFSLAWFFGMALFYPTLAWAGVVLGNIALATRGLFSIAVGMVVARMGHEHLEQRVGGSVLIRRILAAAMMLGAIVLYALQKNM